MAALPGADTSRCVRYVPARLHQPCNLIKPCNPVAQDFWCRLDRGHHTSLRSAPSRPAPQSAQRTPLQPPSLLQRQHRLLSPMSISN
jgi:hypothetical protein